MFQQVLNRKYFRFLAAMPFAVLLISSCQAVSVAHGCLRVVDYATTEGMTIDLRLVRDIIDCAKELHKLYRNTDWKDIPNMIPNTVIDLIDVICSVPNPGKNALTVATRKRNLLFMPLCSLYKLMDSFHQAMSLEMEYKVYRREFERLQMELQFLLDQIQGELLPNWQSSSTTALQKTSTEVFGKLDHFSAELKELLRIIQSGINKGQMNRDVAVSSARSSLLIFGLSIVTGTLPLAVVSGVVCGLSLVSNFALTQLTIQRLEFLQRDVEITCKQIEVYRTFLAHEISQARRLTPISVWLLALVTCLCLICFTYLVIRIVKPETGRAKPKGENVRTLRT